MSTKISQIISDIVSAIPDGALEKYNENHDELGRFAEGDGGSSYYHGTTSDTVSAIMSEGIKPSRGGAGWGAKGYSFLSPTQDGAAYWGENHIDQVGLDPSKTDVVVFEVRVPASVQLERDTQSKLDYRYKGSIPPEWIVGHKTYTWDGHSYKFSIRAMEMQKAGGLHFVPVIVVKPNA